MLGFVIFVVLFMKYTDKEDFGDILFTIMIAEMIAKMIELIF